MRYFTQIYMFFLKFLSPSCLSVISTLKVGIAHEDLAYVSYVFEYGPGNFDEAIHRI